MNDSADPVEEIEAHKDLSCDLFNQIERKSLVVIPLEHFEQIYTQYFKNHTKMIPIRPFVEKRIQQVKNMTIIPIKSSFMWFIIPQGFNPFRVIGFICNFLQDLDLVIWSLKIMRWAFHDFNSNVVSVFKILS